MDIVTEHVDKIRAVLDTPSTNEQVTLRTWRFIWSGWDGFSQNRAILTEPVVYILRQNVRPPLGTTPISLSITRPFYTGTRGDATQTLQIMESSDFVDMVVWAGLYHVAPDVTVWELISER